MSETGIQIPTEWTPDERLAVIAELAAGVRGIDYDMRLIKWWSSTIYLLATATPAFLNENAGNIREDLSAARRRNTTV